MFSMSGKNFFRLSIFCLLLVCSPTVFGQDKEWREVTPAELALKVPQVEADADPEAIFWETRIDLPQGFAVDEMPERGNARDAVR